MAEIYPAYGKEKEVAQRLLALADNVMDVRTSYDNGLAFIVPEDLYAKYLAVDAVVEPEPVSEETQRRRPGRPRKVVPPKEGD
jgi:hypothetical protein